MTIKYYLKSSILFLIGFQTNIIVSQSFNNYSQSLKGDDITIDMVAIKGGDFTMGAPTTDTNRKADEKPAHTVAVDDFWIGKYEITWEQYDAFVYAQFDDTQFQDPSKLKALGIDAVSGATPPYVDMSFNMGKGSCPAVNMTQYAALMYCKWLTSKTGVFYRLPTEAEWEYVCKKGNTDKNKDLNAIAWYEGNGKEKYEKTGLKQANDLGVHDLLGNVSEWVLDQYSTSYYKNSPKNNPWNKPTKLYPRVLRGGSWKDTADKLCCTSRQTSNPKLKRRDPQIPKSDWWHTDAPFIGFRVVRPKIQPTKEEIKAYWLEAIADF
ncbi:formylglycine-generating enzyme family protein [Snuella sedimenti]|uniref:SUMF1/EgtB/PvdO family nonheme iron enzyme n=1 Tax=Snuella sedimenti TaxID=2798802 RepID=A0A8J7IRS5_9FLAO|nr:SUMF1/EgtB/PvdO family nonheme iron enzyme [Snuella sedimenti]MBJ6366650.1 SUMF1/EgtB/PvdO family nonheme iron enzyme [Snuella sedimenti]